MQDDRSFWADIFKKTPLIGTFMVLGGLAAMAMSGNHFAPLLEPRGSLRLFIVLVLGCGMAGAFGGLIVGVFIDSIWAALSGDDKKRR